MAKMMENVGYSYGHINMVYMAVIMFQNWRIFWRPRAIKLWVMKANKTNS